MPIDPTDRYDVFISYRHSNGGTLAEMIRETLAANGLRVFIDTRELRQGKFPEQLTRVIQRCANFVVLLTAGSTERMMADPDDWCLKELEIALQAGRWIVPVREEPVELNADRFPASVREIASIQALSYSYRDIDAFRTKLVQWIDRTDTREGRAKAAWAAMRETMQSDAYRAWQFRHLRDLYAPQFAQHAPDGIDYCPRIAGVDYPIVIYRSADAQTPFVHTLLDPELAFGREVNVLPDPVPSPADPTPAWMAEGDPAGVRTRYFRILAVNRLVHRWNMLGFALAGLTLDERQRVVGYRARPCTYGENCLTSHVLGYQMYEQYVDAQPSDTQPSDTPAAGGLRPDGVRLTPDPDASAARRDVLGIPADSGFSPLISVQGLVVFRPLWGEGWRIVTMRRAGSVAAAPGFCQFPPAGGFEILGAPNERGKAVRQQFDMRMALIREFLEEIYGDADLTGEVEAIASRSLDGSPGFAAVMQSLAAPEKGTRIHFLGVATDLVSLRSEFSFLIAIEDPSLLTLTYPINDAKRGTVARWLAGSSEAKRLYTETFDEVAASLDPRSGDAAPDDGPAAWNPASVGMLKLFAELTADPHSWLRQRYPDMPALRLPD